MRLNNFKKETSERSDKHNHVKKRLIEDTDLFFDSIEGCNQNKNHNITHVFERACVQINESGKSTISEIRDKIIELETEPVLQRKINFSATLGLNLSYVLYNNDIEKVWLFEFDTNFHFFHKETFTGFKQFAGWIQSIKGWKTNSAFRENNDLPWFDKQLRHHGTPWPTNIDCFVSGKNNIPIAILEFQNAHKTDLSTHCNNNYFWGLTQKDDQRRWLSQEILRVKSGLQYIIVTWSKRQKGYVIKSIDTITFPKYRTNSAKCYKSKLSNFAKEKSQRKEKKKYVPIYNDICINYESFKLQTKNGILSEHVNNPPLSFKNKTWPMIYYNEKIENFNSNNNLTDNFLSVISHK